MKLTSILSEIVTGRNQGINFTKYLGIPEPGEDLYDFIERRRFYNSIINSTSPRGMGDVNYETYITLRVPEEEALKYNEIPVDVRSDNFFRFLRKYYGDRIIEVESMPASFSSFHDKYSVPFFVKVRGVVDPEEGTTLPYRSDISEIRTGRNQGIDFTKYLGTPQSGEYLYDFIRKPPFRNSIVNFYSNQEIRDLYISLRVPVEDALKFDELPADRRTNSFLNFLRKYYGDDIIQVISAKMFVDSDPDMYKLRFHVRVPRKFKIIEQARLSNLGEVRSGRELNIQSNLIKTKLSSLADTVSDEVGKSILLGSGTFNTYNKIINSAFYPDSDLIDHPRVGELLRDAALILASQESHEYESYEDIRKMPMESLSQLVFKGFSEDEPMLNDILRVLNGIVKLAYAIQLYEEMEKSILSQLDYYVGKEYYGYKFINYYPQERIGDTVLVFRKVKDTTHQPPADELAHSIIDLDWLDPQYEDVDPVSFAEELEKLLNSKIR